jgi:sugar (pentulose or hexulose) kinase
MQVTAFKVHHVTSWGTAMCAAVGAGVYPDFKQAIEAMSPAASVVEPDSQNTQAYTPYYEKWLATAQWLDKLGDDLG